VSLTPLAVVVALVLPLSGPFADRDDVPEPSAKRIEQSVDTYSIEGSVESVDPPQVNSEGSTLTIGSDVLFAFASAEIADDALAALSTQLAQIPQGAHVLVEGHTDARGGDSVNVPLSVARAQAVADVAAAARADLVLEVVGKASSEPLESETSEEAMARNRRVELSWTS